MSATYSVVRPSQHGEEPKVLETGFESIAEALAWIDEREDLHPYLPYVEAA